MLKLRHEFIKDASTDSVGTAYETFNKTSNTIMVISAQGEGATACTLTFKGKVFGSDTWTPIKAFKSSDFNLVEEGTLNEAYIVDCASWAAINVEASNIAGGNVTVVGEVIE